MTPMIAIPVIKELSENERELSCIFLVLLLACERRRNDKVVTGLIPSKYNRNQRITKRNSLAI